MPTYLEIAVNVPQVTGVFHYHAPPELEGRLQLGQLVVVPFGAQTVQGVVLRLVDQPEVEVTRPILDIVDPSAVLTAHQIALARALSEACLAPLSACISLMLPPGLAQQADTIYALRDPGSLNLEAGSSSFTTTQQRLLSLLQSRGPQRGRQIEHALRHLNWKAAARGLVRQGLLTTQSVLPPPMLHPKTIRTAQLACPPDIAEAALPELGHRQVWAAELADSPQAALAQLDRLGRADSPALKRRQAMLRLLACTPGPVEADSLFAASGGSLADLRRLAELGLAVLIDKPSPALVRRQSMLRFLMQEPGPVEVTWVYAHSGGDASDLQELAERNLVVLGESEVWRDPLERLDFQPTSAPALTHDQQEVWDAIQQHIQRLQAGQKTPPILLHGVTGSGKTEIYLQAVAEMLRLGKQAIILVPEIALTPQTVHRFVGRFPGQVGLVHSGLSAGERYDTWRRAREGLVSVVVGPRSALFTPFARLGLIVLDEFHDDSYYQTESEPFYSAVETAVTYARLAGAICLLGSATPDVVSAARASRGLWLGLNLPVRILAHQQAIQAQVERLGLESHYQPLEGQAETIGLPPVQVVDMRRELREGNRSIFSRRLQAALAEVLERRQQAILFLNRRGSATYVFCRDCGAVIKCPKCDLPLSYHLEKQVEEDHEPAANRLTCHHCGYQRSMPKTCPQCGSRQIRQYGAGTEKVEAEVRALFPQARTLRWDAETTRQKGAHELILSHFAAHRSDVLIGTQMLAKGLDLPLVTLVGAVLADVGLFLPDYRAAERTFQVLTQVAGRAGRSLLGGQVVLQTFQPEHYAIQAASQHDFKGFYQKDLEYRRRLGYPPFSRLVRLEYRSPKPDEAERVALEMAAQIRTWLDAEDRRATQLVGPAPCFFARLGGQYRWQIILRGPDPASLLRGRGLSGWLVQVNPPNLL